MAKIAEIIKYEGDNSTFVWKHPSEDFNSLTQLIVHESQEALFFMNGQALDLFGPGRYTLSTQNIPLIGKLLNKATGGESPFHCEVYFINKTVQMGIKWGTPERVRFMEPTYGVPLDIGASGELNLTVSDSRKLMVKLVGTMNGIAWTERGMGFTKSLQDSFRPLISTAVKTHLSESIISQNINILEIDRHLTVLSESLRSRIAAGFEEYGLTVPQFYISTVSLPTEDDNFKNLRVLYSESLKRKKEIEEKTTEIELAKKAAEIQLIEAQVKAEAAKMEGFAAAEVMRAKGYDHKDELQAEVQKAYAAGIGNMGSNGGGSGVAGDMVGLIGGMAVAGQLGNQMGQMFSGINPQMQNAEPAAEKAATITCVKCGASLPATAKFCFGCGEKVINLADNEIICPACGEKTQKGKFCMECGAPLVRTCTKCGTEIPTGAKFCPECGEKA